MLMPENGRTYYDKDGKAITREQWSVYQNAATYRHLRTTQVTSAADPHQSFLVCTTWMGYDLSPRWLGAPVIFETLVFDHEIAVQDIHSRWYGTTSDAELGHQQVVHELTGPMNEPLVSDIHYRNPT